MFLGIFDLNGFFPEVQSGEDVVCDISGEGWLDGMRKGRVEWTNGDGVVYLG